MKLSYFTRRTAVFGLAVAVTGCDVAEFATGSAPGFVQTWNLPASSTAISVASLLPADVSIYSTPSSNPPDSSAFLVNVNNVNFQNSCTTCPPLHGTVAPKPAFISTSGSLSSLPANVVSGAVIGGTVTYTITNTLSFDPLRVSANLANPQGVMTIVVRSGSLVLGRQVVSGDTVTMPAGSTFIRDIPMTTGTAIGAIAVDMTINSPVGDNTLIDANGRLTTAAAINGLLLGTASINVPSATLNSGTPAELPSELDEGIIKRVIRGVMELTITNPFAVAGNVDVNFTYAPGQTVTKNIPMTASATSQELIPLDSTEMSSILRGDPTTFLMTGAAASTAPIAVTPKQVVFFSNRLRLALRAFGGQ